MVTYNQYGDKVGEDVKRTAGEPAQMKFSVETPDHEPIACSVSDFSILRLPSFTVRMMSPFCALL